MVAERADDVATVGVPPPLARCDHVGGVSVRTVIICEQVQNLDAGFIAQQSGRWRAGPELIARMQEDRAAGSRPLCPLQISHQRRGPAHRPRQTHFRRLKIAVKIVETDDLYMQRVRPPDARS